MRIAQHIRTRNVRIALQSCNARNENIRYDMNTTTVTPVTPANVNPDRDGNKAPTNNAVPDIELVNKYDLLEVAELVLTWIGHPCHHTTIYAGIKYLGLWTEKSHNVNPRIWNETIKNADKTPFRFYGKSVFGMKRWHQDIHKTWERFVPGRVAPTAAQTVEDLEATIIRQTLALNEAKETLRVMKARAAAKAKADAAGK